MSPLLAPARKNVCSQQKSCERWRLFAAVWPICPVAMPLNKLSNSLRRHLQIHNWLRPFYGKDSFSSILTVCMFDNIIIIAYHCSGAVHVKDTGPARERSVPGLSSLLYYITLLLRLLNFRAF